MAPPAIIPLPLQYETLPGQCRLSGSLVIGCTGEGSLNVGKYFASYLTERLRLAAQARAVGEPASTYRIHLCCADMPQLLNVTHTEEAYLLRVSEDCVTLQANRPHGLFNGVQSLIQLLPPKSLEAPEIVLECMQILDAPAYQWRGMLLDVGRHFFEVPFILKLLDACALYKINRFHWHLTEDQGWRLEVKQYPRLTEFGAWRGPEKEGEQAYGGFYTQDQVRSIVTYAAERFIEVIPEIELPGHCGAAIACYPQLSCQQTTTDVPTQWGVHEDVYCAGKEETFTFLEGVLDEVLDLFPSRYVHIGGDECPKVRWAACEDCQRRLRDEGLADEYALQSWFITRIASWLAARERALIGWDEILEGGLAPGAVVMSWRGISGGVKAAKSGHEVIMSPTSHCYFDYRQTVQQSEPGAWYAVLQLETVYDFDPLPPSPEPSRETDESSTPPPPPGSPPVAAAPTPPPQQGPSLVLRDESPGSPHAMSTSTAPGPVWDMSLKDSVASGAPGSVGGQEAMMTSMPASNSADAHGMRSATDITGEAMADAVASTVEGDEDDMGTVTTNGEASPEIDMLNIREGEDGVAAGDNPDLGDDAMGDVVVHSAESTGLEHADEAMADPGLHSVGQGESDDVMHSAHRAVQGNEEDGMGDGAVHSMQSAGQGVYDDAMAGVSQSEDARGDDMASLVSEEQLNGGEAHMIQEPTLALHVKPGPILPDQATTPGTPAGRERSGSGSSSVASALRSGAPAMEEGSGDMGGPGSSNGSCAAGPLAPPGMVAVMLPVPFGFSDWTLPREFASNVIGGQANLWTEYIKDEATVEYMLLPRLCALAEAVWTPRSARSWPCFRTRLESHLPHLDARNFRYHPL